MKLIYVIIVVFMIFVSGCRGKYEDCTDRDYENCQNDRPKTGILNVDLTLNAENPFVVVRLYKGNFEDGNLISLDTVKRASRTYTIEAETDYSATATYRRGNNLVLTIDGGKVDIISYRMCEMRCYEARRLNMDLRLH